MQMIYSPNGEHLFTIGPDGHLRVHDVLQLYLPIKVLPLGSAPQSKVAMSLSPDGKLLCTSSKAASEEHASLLLFSGALCWQPTVRVRATRIRFHNWRPLRLPRRQHVNTHVSDLTCSQLSPDWLALGSQTFHCGYTRLQ